MSDRNPATERRSWLLNKIPRPWPGDFMRRRPQRPSGYTLAEMLIVVAILGIVAAMGMPVYRKTVQQSYYRAAQSVLQIIYAGERAYFFQAGFYKGGLASATGNWRTIFMDDPNFDVSRVTYSVDCSDCRTGFIATATRKSGPCVNRIRTINQMRVFGGNWPQDPDAC